MRRRQYSDVELRFCDSWLRLTIHPFAMTHLWLNTSLGTVDGLSTRSTFISRIQLILGTVRFFVVAWSGRGMPRISCFDRGWTKSISSGKFDDERQRDVGVNWIYLIFTHHALGEMRYVRALHWHVNFEILLVKCGGEFDLEAGMCARNRSEPLVMKYWHEAGIFCCVCVLHSGVDVICFCKSNIVYV